MGKFYIPYKGKKPASVNINGHQLVLLSTDPEELKDSLGIFNGDRVKDIDAGDTEEERTNVVINIARKSSSGVVFAPQEIRIKEVLKNLERELPWVQ